jgi:hypothetical protein
MKYKEAMAGIDKKQLEEAVEEDYQKFEKLCACLRLSELKPFSRMPSCLMPTTWAMKKNAIGNYGATVNA